MLIHFGVIPYLVFDGDYLPSKAATEVERAQRRQESKKRGLGYYQMNKPSQAHLELQKAVDVTPVMARELIEELKKAGVQYVVAPYEADAQLVYLEKKGLTQGTLSEDSDLLVFGAKRLLTKLDQYGDCVEINQADFTACREISLIGWTDAEFRRMAILSGCDYLASINGMGLKNAYRLVRKHKTIEKIIRMLQFDGKFNVPAGYLEAFHKAELTFLHQRVFCPLRRDLVMLTEVKNGTRQADLSFVGAEVEKETAIAVADGDLDPVTKAPIAIPASSNYSSKAVWTSTPRKPEGTPFSELKANKSIETYFKSRRTPLAELDPNAFTPSPTQERLLQQAIGTAWDSSPASMNPPTLQSHISIPPATYQTPSSGRGTNSGQPAPLTAPNSSKRRRLFDGIDENECPKTTQKTGEIRSQFFTANISEATPTSKQTKRSKKAKNSTINIWSDDSIEDAMAKLPDVSSAPAPPKTYGLEIFGDENQKLAGSTTSSGLPEESNPAEDSQSSVVSRETISSEASASTIATSTISAATPTEQILDRFVSTELATLSAECTSFQTNTRNSSLQQPLSNRAQQSFAPEQDSRQNSQTRFLRQQSMTPLQRLRAGALNRSKSCGDLLPETTVETIGDAPAAKLGGDSLRIMPSLPMVHSIGPDASMMKGSEDTMISDSEDDVSDATSERGEQPKLRMSLGHFAFAG